MTVATQEAFELVEAKKYAQLVAKLSPQSVCSMEDEERECLSKLLKSVPEEEIRKSPMLCFFALSHDLLRGKTAMARQRFSQLVALRDSRKEGSAERATLLRLTSCAGLMLPQTDNGQILLLLSILHNETISHRFKPIPLCVTNRRPSVLRGSKDLSEWGKNYRAVASIARPLLESILPGAEAGACSAAIAELLYEKNDLNAAAIEVAGAVSCQNAEIAFAGYATLARISSLDNTAGRRPEELLAGLGNLLEEHGAGRLLDNYRALCAGFAMTAGRLEEVQAWLDESGLDGIHDCIPINSYRLMMKAKALIALGQYREAATLLESLLLLQKEDFQPLDTAECLMLSAVACERMGSSELALDKLEQALAIAAPYRYIRVIADGGRPVFHLLNQLVKQPRRLEDLPERYLQGVMEAAMTYSMLYPRLFAEEEKGGGVQPGLTSAELQVLQYMNEGKSNKEIAAVMSVQLSTVKFHAGNLYEKLEVSNRVGAINAAKRFGII